MRKNLTKIFDTLLVSLLACLGLNSCGPSSYSSKAVVYGAPYDVYEINGTVTNIADSKPIKNILVVSSKQGSSADSTYTDSDGKYRFVNSKSIDTDTLKLQIIDIDGELNGGEFAKQNIDVVFTDDDRVKKSDGTFTRNAYAKTQNITLTQVDNK